MASLLPQIPGLLPKWIGLVGVIALANGFSSFLSPTNALQVYDKTPIVQVSPLAQRLFGTWTFTNGIIRAYAAYHLNDPTIYALVVWSYAIAMVYFLSEYFLFKSFTLNRATVPPILISSGSLAWMWLQRDFYLG